MPLARRANIARALRFDRSSIEEASAVARYDSVRLLQSAAIGSCSNATLSIDQLACRSTLRSTHHIALALIARCDALITSVLLPREAELDSRAMRNATRTASSAVRLITHTRARDARHQRVRSPRVFAARITSLTVGCKSISARVGSWSAKGFARNAIPNSKLERQRP